MGRPRSWSDDDLRAAVAASRTYKEVHERLGLLPSGGSHSAVRIRIAELGLDVAHFTPRRRFARPRRPPGERPGRSGSALDRLGREALAAAVAPSRSIAQALQRLGIGVSGGSYAAFKAPLARYGIDTSHFTGQGWSRGLQITRNAPRPLEELLVADSTVTSTHHLRLRLIREGVKAHRCEVCGRTEWRGRPGAAAARPHQRRSP